LIDEICSLVFTAIQINLCQVKSIKTHSHSTFDPQTNKQPIIMPDLRPNPTQRDIPKDAAQEGANQAPEEISNKARGHKANLSNPNTSEASKENSKEALKDLGGESAFYSKDSK